MSYHNPMPPAKINQTLKQLPRRRSPRRHMRIIHPHQLYPLQRQTLQSLKIRLPTRLLLQIIRKNLSHRQPATARISRITRIRNQNPIPRIQKSQTNMQNPLLRTYQRQDLTLRIETNPITPRIPISHRRSQLRQSHKRLITMRISPTCRLYQRLHDISRRHPVRPPYSKANNITPLGIQPGNLAQLPRKIILLNLIDPAGRLNFLHTLYTLQEFLNHLSTALLPLSTDDNENNYHKSNQHKTDTPTRAQPKASTGSSTNLYHKTKKSSKPYSTPHAYEATKKLSTPYSTSPHEPETHRHATDLPKSKNA